MPDTYTANEDGSYTVVNAGETQFINFTAFNPETGYKWSSMQEVKTFCCGPSECLVILF